MCGTNAHGHHKHGAPHKCTHASRAHLTSRGKYTGTLLSSCLLCPRTIHGFRIPPSPLCSYCRPGPQERGAEVQDGGKAPYLRRGHLTCSYTTVWAPQSLMGTFVLERGRLGVWEWEPSRLEPSVNPDDTLDGILTLAPMTVLN